MTAGAVLDKPELAAPAHPPIREIGPEEVLVLLDRRARRYLGMSGEEFLRRWRAGEYASDPDQPGVIDLAMLVPFAPPAAA
ncbi:MAG: hypothetical protein ACRDJN_21025 [Chloroflexota bacterium]